MFGNPVPGVIAPKGGTSGFRVTSTFADHVAGGRPPGVDIGNGREGDPVLAAATGIVSERFQDPNGALVLRLQHPALTGRPVTGYAHLRAITVQKGQLLQRGQQLGTLGSTGAPGQPHLHWGVNIGGREVDGWPMLDQNQEDDVKVQGAIFGHTPNRTTTITAAPKGNLMSGPSFSVPNIAQLPSGTEVEPLWTVHGQAVGTRGDVWHWCSVHRRGVDVLLGYLFGDELGEFMAIEDDAGAYNDGLAAAQAAVEALPER